MMKRIFMLMAVALMLVAAMALSGVAQAASPRAKCKQEAASLGLSLDGYKIIVGSDRKNDDFSSKGTAGHDVFCGFGGNDYISQLAYGDIFIGGAGNDNVGGNSGTFYGGEGDDVVVDNYSPLGTFYGGAGNDEVTNNSGIFYGEAGGDSVGFNSSEGTFDGGDGNDFVYRAEAGGLVVNVP